MKKAKKPFYKRVLFWIFVVFVALIVWVICSPVDTNVSFDDAMRYARDDFGNGSYDLAFNYCESAKENYPDEASAVDELVRECIGAYPHLSASELFAQFDANEVKADDEYSGKPVVVNGTIGDIQKDGQDYVYVLLDNGAYDFACVQLQFYDEQAEAVADLVVGGSVTVVGKCLGQTDLLLDNLIIDDCYIIEG